MKIRPAQAAVALLISSIGATNVQAAAPEVRDVLGKGVADAVTFPWGSIVLFGIDKVTKFHMEVPLYTTGFVWVMNPGTYAAIRKSAASDRRSLQQALGGKDRRALGRLRA